MKFCEKVRQLRREKHWTQEELAGLIGVSKRTLLGYESGDYYPRKREVYHKMAELFGVDVNYLLTEDEAFMTEVGARYGLQGQRQARTILEQTAMLFAGGSLSEEDQIAFITEIQQLYLDAKKSAKKYGHRKTENDGDDA